jgi:hypothetical protein
LVKKSLLLKMQQLILGTGIAIWWLTEPHWVKPKDGAKPKLLFNKPVSESNIIKLFTAVIYENS